MTPNSADVGATIADSRRHAKAIEAPYYWGSPCKRGHTPLRYATGSCVTCAEMRRARHRVEQRAYAKAHYAANRTEYIVRAADWRKANPEQRREIANAWVRNNPAKALAAVRKRQAAKLQRTPPWADLNAIEAFYLARPLGYVIDHVIPLRGKLVSGLHVLNNLQYLTPESNMMKLNKFDPETYVHDL